MGRSKRLGLEGNVNTMGEVPPGHLTYPSIEIYDRTGVHRCTGFVALVHGSSLAPCLRACAGSDTIDDSVFSRTGTLRVFFLDVTQVLPMMMVHSKQGSSSAGTLIRIDRAIPGSLVMNPFFSSVRIIWWTDGGETRKYTCMSASAGARPWSFV